MMFISARARKIQMYEGVPMPSDILTMPPHSSPTGNNLSQREEEAACD
jgi:hypothetical protein